MIFIAISEVILPWLHFSLFLNLTPEYTCFGNTLVHLQSIELMGKMLKGVFAVLKPGGHFLLQILNYDFILDEQVSELPLIDSIL